MQADGVDDGLSLFLFGRQCEALYNGKARLDMQLCELDRERHLPTRDDPRRLLVSLRTLAKHASVEVDQHRELSHERARAGNQPLRARRSGIVEPVEFLLEVVAHLLRLLREPSKVLRAAYRLSCIAAQV